MSNNWYKQAKNEDLKNKLIRLGSENPELQKHIRPVLDKISSHQKEGMDRQDPLGEDDLVALAKDIFRKVHDNSSWLEFPSIQAETGVAFEGGKLIPIWSLEDIHEFALRNPTIGEAEKFLKNFRKGATKLQEMQKQGELDYADMETAKRVLKKYM